MEYGPRVKQRFDAPTHAGEWPPGTPDTLTGEASDRTLQVWVRFQLRTSGGIVSGARFRAFGCPHTLAAAEWVAEQVEGTRVESARGLDVQALRAALDVPVEKLGKLLKVEDALAACWRERDGGQVRSAGGSDGGSDGKGI
jgi:NifU-like protein involved in Fe-S cluster formation